ISAPAVESESDTGERVEPVRRRDGEVLDHDRARACVVQSFQLEGALRVLEILSSRPRLRSLGAATALVSLSTALVEVWTSLVGACASLVGACASLVGATTSFVGACVSLVGACVSLVGASGRW